MNFGKALIAALVGFTAVSLQGCGCDKDKVSKCTAGDCAGLSKCFKDSDCCTYEEDGVKVKDLIDVACALIGTADASKNACR